MSRGRAVHGSGGRYCPYGVWLMRPDGRLLLPAICPEFYYPHDRARGESRLGSHSMRVFLTNFTPGLYSLGAPCGKEGRNTRAVSLGQCPRSGNSFPVHSPESMKSKTNQSLTHHSHDTIIIINGNSNNTPKLERALHNNSNIVRI